MMPLLLLAADEAYRYVPFVKPLPVAEYYYLLALPLCLGIAIVYKCLRVESMRRLPREALGLFVFIMTVLLITAGVLAALVNVLEL